MQQTTQRCVPRNFTVWELHGQLLFHLLNQELSCSYVPYPAIFLSQSPSSTWCTPKLTVWFHNVCFSFSFRFFCAGNVNSQNSNRCLRLIHEYSSCLLPSHIEHITICSLVDCHTMKTGELSTLQLSTMQSLQTFWQFLASLLLLRVAYLFLTGWCPHTCSPKSRSSSAKPYFSRTQHAGHAGKDVPRALECHGSFHERWGSIMFPKFHSG